VGGVYLVMPHYEQQLVYAPSTLIKKTARDAKLSFDNIALPTDGRRNIQGGLSRRTHRRKCPERMHCSDPALLSWTGREYQ